MDEFWSNALWSVTPTVLVGLIFWFIMRSVIHADRNERKAYAQVEAAERARMGLPPADGPRPASDSRPTS
jgi:hypothetical protein